MPARPLSVATKVFLGFVAVLASFGVVSLYGVTQMRNIGRDLGLLSAGYFPLAQVAAQLETYQKERERDRERLVKEPDPRARLTLVQRARAYPGRVVREKIAAARKLAAAAREEAKGQDQDVLRQIEAHLAALDALNERYDAAAEQVYAALVAQSGPPDVHDLEKAELGLDREIALLVATLEGRIDRGVASAEERERRTAYATIALSLFAILVGLAATVASTRLLSPIRALTEAARGVSRGDYVHVPNTARSDEVGVLTREFNAMAESLREREARLKAQGEALVRSERLAAVGRLAAQVAHEIRNPLSSIGLNAELLGDAIEEHSTGESRALLTKIGREVDRLAEITESYLRFARLPKPSVARVELNDVLAELLDFHAEELAAARVSVERRFGDAPPVQADPALLRQVFVNLVKNAREAMPEGGALLVATRTEGREAVVEVRDTGVGIDPAARERLFEPFFTTKERGTGLGLALSQQILQQHGGGVQVSSDPGKGTAFVVRLPAAPAVLAPLEARSG